VQQVSQWIFGQQFPDASAPVTQQAFAVVAAVGGLAAFALVLALVEQVVMELIQTHVMTGSPVYEDGHVSPAGGGGGVGRRGAGQAGQHS